MRILKRSITKLIFTVLLAVITFSMYGQELTVMSYNIRLDVAADGENRWDARREKLAGLMSYHNADFIGGQEVQHHQLLFLLLRLPDYNYIGVGRDDGKNAGEFSTIFYKRDKYDLLENGTFWLSPTPDSISKGWDAALNRICTYGLFRDKKTKQTFWIMNTHFDHIGKEARLESANLIVRKMGELNTKKYPVILMGDLNARPEDPPIHYLTQVMQNSRRISEEVYGPAATWNGFKFNELPDGCIDYIFTSNDPRIKVKKFATLTDSYAMKYPSDHFPIIATFQINKK